MRPAVLLVALTACGRLDFGASLDAIAVDAATGFGPFHGMRELSVNSTFREYGASISSDKLELYFTSNRDGTFSTYRATRATTADDFTNPVLEPFGGPAVVQEPALARNDLDMYLNGPLVTHRTSPVVAWNAPAGDSSLTGFVGLDYGAADLHMVMNGADNQLYEATRPDHATAWSTPAMITELVGNRLNQNYPTMTDDGLEIFYQAYDVANTTSTILHATRTALDQPFGPSTPAIDTTFSIGDPGISGDGTVLVYSSDESDAVNSDLWIAERDPP